MSRNNIIFEKFLIEKLKSGDPDSFSDIFSAYYQDLVFFAFTFTHELPSAEDIVQDTFIQLWDDHENLNVTISLKSILLKTVQNKCIDWHRHKLVVNNHSTFIINNSLVYEYDTDNYILRSELEDKIIKAVAGLPEHLKESFMMSREEGLKYQEIAARLNVSLRTVEVRISKALELLRNDLVEYFVN